MRPSFLNLVCTYTYYLPQPNLTINLQINLYNTYLLLPSLPLFGSSSAGLPGLANKYRPNLTITLQYKPSQQTVSSSIKSSLKATSPYSHKTSIQRPYSLYSSSWQPFIRTARQCQSVSPRRHQHPTHLKYLSKGLISRSSRT